MSQIEEEFPQVKSQTSQLETQLIEGIIDSLQNHADQNATFLAERLVYEHDTEEHRSLLAECYLYENKAYKVCHILKDCKSEYNRYQLALAYFRCGKFKESEQTLCGGNFVMSVQPIPNGSYGHYLLAQVYEQLHRIDDAKNQYMKALDLNPTLWMCFERLSRLGESVQINKVFNEQKQKSYEQNRGQQCNILKTITNIKTKRRQSDHNPEELLIPQQRQAVKLSSPIQTQYANIEDNKFLQQKPRPKQIPPTINFSNYQALLQQPFQQKMLPKKISNDVIQKVSSSALSNQVLTLPSFLKLFAHPYYLWCNYSIDTISNFQKLPPTHYRSGWVLEKVARNFMDQVKYTDAERIWKEVRDIEPYRLEGMDYYSSCLWHLKKQVDLTYLAHFCLQTSIMAPETWIAIGNCFSQIKEIDNSLKFFQRAISLRPDYSYAQTLSGHEFSQNENFQQARKCYDQAINLDHRQYNAWWGQGNMYYKTDKYEEACKCFSQAMKINPNNPVLPTFLAMSLAAKGDHIEALKYFQVSEKLDPINGLNKYQKANTLIKLDHFDQALQELQKLSTIIPKEAPIFILMGRIHKKLGNIQEAQKCFTTALSLDQKDQAKIKGLIESLHNANNEFNDNFDL